MNNKLASFACIVSASNADLIQYWVMASLPQQAVSAVQLMLGREWTAAVANPRLKQSCLERLKLRPDEMRELVTQEVLQLKPAGPRRRRHRWSL
jgi:hypothetical protein